MNVGDRVYIRAKKLPDGTYFLSEFKNEDASDGFTDNVPCEIDKASERMSRFGVIPDSHIKWKYSNCQDRWWTDKENLTLIDSAPNTLRCNVPVESVLCCRECEDGYPMAVPNCKDGTLACWSCRESKGWKFKDLLNVR